MGILAMLEASAQRRVPPSKRKPPLTRDEIATVLFNLQWFGETEIGLRPRNHLTGRALVFDGEIHFRVDDVAAYAGLNPSSVLYWADRLQIEIATLPCRRKAKGIRCVRCLDVFRILMHRALRSTSPDTRTQGRQWVAMQIQKIDKQLKRQSE